MVRHRRPRLRAPFFLLALLAPAAPVRAEDPAPAGAPPAESKDAAPTEVKAATDEEAKNLVAALEAASKKKAKEVLKSLQAWEGLRHEAFLKPLTKLLRHEDEDVAVRAARILETQKPTGADEKTAAKNVDKALRELWKLAFQQSVNDSRHSVKGAVVKVHGAWGVTLDENEFDEVKSLWRANLGNADVRRVAALVSVVNYVEAAKDKRFSRMLAEQIDEPKAGDVNSPSNPPASYWEARWKGWKAMEAPVQRALKSLTGQEFKTTADAKKWFEANERTYGFRW
jgi:hypothetical protein